MSVTLQQHINTISSSIKEYAQDREIVSWGFAPDVFKILEENGVFIKKIYTGSMDLIQKNGCLHFSELNQKHEQYYVIFPLSVALDFSIPTIRQYGFKDSEDFTALCPPPESRIIRGPLKEYTDIHGNILRNIPPKCSIDLRTYGNKIVFDNLCQINGNLKITIIAPGCLIEIDEKATFNRSNQIHFDGDIGATLSIGSHTRFTDSFFALHPMSRMTVGTGSTFAARCTFFLSAETQLKIGKDCMFSYDIVCHPADGHSIFNTLTGENINSLKQNKVKYIELGDHVWVGYRSFILGNTRVKTGGVIGAQSTVKGDFPNNVIIAGNPAKVIRNNIAWSRRYQSEDIATCMGYTHATCLEETNMSDYDIAKINLNEITFFDEYLRALINIKNTSLILIAARDTVGMHLKKESSFLLQQLGLHADLCGKHGHSFIAILNKGEVLTEALSSADENLDVHTDCNDIDLYLFSSVYLKNDQAIIRINGKNEAVDLRGLNIVVYDYKLNSVIDSVCFDTHDADNVCYRKEERLAVQQTSSYRKLKYLHYHLQDEVDYLKKSLRDISFFLKEDSYKKQQLLWYLLSKTETTELEARKEFFLSIPSAEDDTFRKVQLAGLILLVELDRVCREHNIKYWISFGTLLGAVRHHGFVPWDDDTDVGMLREDVIKLQKVMNNNEHFKLDEFYTVRNQSPGYIDHNYQLHFVEEDTPYCLDIYVYDYSDHLPTNIIQSLQLMKRQMENESLSIAQSSSQRRKNALSKEYGNAYRQLFNRYYLKQTEVLGDIREMKYMIWSIDNTKYGAGKRTNLPCDFVFPLTEVCFENHSFYAPSDPDYYVKVLYGDIYTFPEDMFTHTHFNLSEKQIGTLNMILEKHKDLI